jgi:hypothetical protein
MFATNGYSQKSIGVFAGYSTSFEGLLGFGGNFTFNLTDIIKNAPNAVRIAPGMNYFSGSKEYEYSIFQVSLNLFEVHLDAHYLLDVAEMPDKFNVYPLFGFNHTSYRLGVGEGVYLGVGKFGVNVGAGASYDYSDKLVFGAELKYVIARRVTFGLTCAYKL